MRTIIAISLLALLAAVACGEETPELVATAEPTVGSTPSATGAPATPEPTVTVAAMPTPTAMPEPTNATRPITPTPTTMDEVTNTPTPTATPEPTTTPEPTATPTPTATLDNTPKTEFGNGSYEVGVDIAPGTYRSEGPEDPFPFCSFARLKTAGASFMDLDQVINIQNVQGPAIAKIEASDGGFFSQGCKTWVRRN